MEYTNLLPAIAIFLLSIILAIRNLRVSFFLLIILSPFVHKELFSLGGVWDLLPIRIMFGGAAIGAFYHLIRWAKKKGFKRIKPMIIDTVVKDPFLILLLLLWIVRLLWIKKSAAPDESLKLFLFFTSVIGIYLVFKNLFMKHSTKFIEKAIYLYLGVGVFTGFFAVLQYYLRLCCRWSIGGIWVVPDYTPRLGSTFWDVNHFGGFLITMIPVSLGLFLASKSIKYKVINLFGTGFFSILLFFTQSRSSWFGLVVGMLISFVIYYFAKLRMPLILFGSVCIIGLISIFTFTTYNQISIRDKVANYMQYRLDSTDTHLLLLEGAGEIFVNNIVLGAGYGNFDHAFRGTVISDVYFNREPRLKESKVPPHSVWGEVLAETGAVGVVLYSLLMGLIVVSLITTTFTVNRKFARYLGIGLLGGAVSILSAGFFYSYNMEFYWIYLFICIAYVIKTLDRKLNLPYVINWWYSKGITPYLIIVPPALFYIFLKLGSTTLIDWDEAIYAKVAKNIVQSGEWFSLRWDDVDKFWFEKPPLYMWLTALVFKVTGFNSLGARLVSAILGFIGIVLVYKFGSRLYNKLTGIFSSLILLSIVHYLYYSRNGMLDVAVTVFIMATVYLFYLGMENVKGDPSSRDRPSLYFAISGIFLGLAVMTKGVIGLIPIPIHILYLVYIWLKSPKPRPILISDIRIVFIFMTFFLFIAAPWHIYSVIVHGNSFWDTYFIDHMLGRGLSGFGHEKSLTWFLEVIKVSTRIWVFPLIGGLLFLPFIDKKRKELVLLLISSFFVLTFFSMSKDKLQWYIMPIYPFLAIISARFMERFLVFINSILRMGLKMDHMHLRVLGLFAVFVISVFYVVIIRDRVYYPDFNENKVALVKIHNQLYPIADYPDRKLYYSKIAPPVLLFYSDHRVKSTNENNILRMIDEANPAENFSFLIPEDMYYEIQEMGDTISAPLSLNVKGASKGWVLLKSRSRVELLMDELNIWRLEMDPLNTKAFLEIISPEERLRLDYVNSKHNEVVDKLTGYGYPPY